MPAYKQRIPRRGGSLEGCQSDCRLSAALVGTGDVTFPPLVIARNRRGRRTRCRDVALLRLWRRRARERALLAALDRRMLGDIGVEPSDVPHEINKPFWGE
jgi:uncharacterized protein YjiS (DUF1127 family)